MNESQTPPRPTDQDLVFDPTTDADGPSVYVGALIPQRLEALLQREAALHMVPRSQIVRWALADRYTNGP